MSIFEQLESLGHEQLALAADPTCGYRGIIAVHSTVLGPAVGGTRWWSYRSEEEAIVDALRLSRGMSYKTALAGLPLGGGKAVILATGAPVDRPAVLRAHGRFIDRFQGTYYTGEDVGTSPADMEFIAETTRFVAGRAKFSGDPSPHTARGVFRAMQAGAMIRWGTDRLAGKTVAVQGCGNVGYNLAWQLTEAGARVIASDIDPARVAKVVHDCQAAELPVDRIHEAAADIFAPCALGGILNDQTIPALKVGLICGGANNQLLEPRHGQLLRDRGILYVPDYVANAGGVSFGGSIEVLKLNLDDALTRVDQIYQTTLMVLERAAADRLPPSDAADRLAEERIRKGKFGAAPGAPGA
jgi:leucine dehydrogenase